MRITSLNLQGFTDWEARMPRVVAYLRSMAPDVILFQEVVWLPEIAPVTQLDLLSREMDYPYRHQSVTRLQRGRVTADYREGLGLLSRHPVPSTEALVLHHEQGDPHQRIVQLADVDVDGTTWPLMNVHLSVRDDFALHHLEEVLRMQEARHERRILGGDFNVDHLERHRELWRGWARLTSEQLDYLSRPLSRETDDYFLVPDRYEIAAVQISGDGLSDHRALTVDLIPALTTTGSKPAPGRRSEPAA
ncbi:MAG TPA: endonuclease/exonuclease/phosphatase family protein [Amnibacterium sp.]|jgi:endonuclease/exonuclease/phosphatase family metal-dependent hydrolase|uniref:endonuclease/exonuclease/phosphatase family protein n=1 Tax=Amnibacterium sp. TaxID=1872496 RepID=UPI002F92584D